MFNKDKSTLGTLASIIYTLLAAEHGLEQCNETDLKRFSRAVAIAMLGAKNFKEFDQMFDQIDITVLHQYGPAALYEHVRGLLQEAKNKRS